MGADRSPTQHVYIVTFEGIVTENKYDDSAVGTLTMHRVISASKHLGTTQTASVPRE